MRGKLIDLHFYHKNQMLSLAQFTMDVQVIQPKTYLDNVVLLFNPRLGLRIAAKII